jgi:hypothetical protein
MEKDSQIPADELSNNRNQTVPDNPNEAPIEPQVPYNQISEPNRNMPDRNLSQKPQNRKSLIIAIVSLAVLIVGSIVFLFLSPKSVQAQVESLVNLYLKVDYVRSDSARIFAELLESQRSPERMGSGTQELGEKPFLATKDELLHKITINRNEVLNAISIIKSEAYSSEEVARVHAQLKDHYQKLFEFEDRVVEGLAEIQIENDFAIFINDVFENSTNWPSILDSDAKLRSTLKELAERNNVEFTDISYEDAFRQKLIELDTPKVDPTQFGIAEKQFTIPQGFTQANISISIGPGADVSDLVYGLRREETGKVINFMISEAPGEKEDYTIIINKLPQADTKENITANIIPSELFPTVDRNKAYHEAKIDYGRSYLVFTLYPDDPVLYPVHGDWTIFVLAPAGLNIVIGATHI